MKVLSGLFVVLVIIALPTVADAQFYDNFDAYTLGSLLIGQGTWEGWAGDPTVDAQVTNAQSDTAPHSINLAPDASFADVVTVFAGLNTGTWYAKVQTYIPTGHTGETYFIMLNTYDGGASIFNWSMQVGMTGEGTGLVTSYGGTDTAGTGTTPLLYDQWVEIVAEINLDANTYSLWYGGVQLETDLSWNTSGLQEI